MKEQEAGARERRRKVKAGPHNHMEEWHDPQRVAEQPRKRGKRADATPTSPAAQWFETHEHRPL